MTTPRLYADYNATAPLRPEARAAMLAALDVVGNPSSVHGEGRRAKAQLETAREAIGATVGARPGDVVFTSGATEALHLAMDASAAHAQSLIVFAGEHSAVDDYAAIAFETVFRLDATASGLVDLDHLGELLAVAPAPALVAVMMANNETGAVQPIGEVSALVRAHGGHLLVDAAQALGRLPIDMAALGATYLVASSHKLGGPPGAGCLVLASGAPFMPVRFGGGQERGRRPGTENTPAIAGFGAGVAQAAAALGGGEAARLGALRDRFERELLSIAPEAIIFAEAAPRLPNTSLFAIPGWTAERALIALDLQGVAVSSGAACSSGKVRMSHVLAAMGVAPDLAACALRVSFGWASQGTDIERLILALAKAARLRTGAKGARS